MPVSIKAKIETSKKRKDGKCPVSIHFRIDGELKKLSTGLYALPETFDNAAGNFKGQRGEDAANNTIIRNKIHAIDTAVMWLRERSKEVTIRAVEERIGQKKDFNFNEFYKKQLWTERSQLAFKTYQQYEYVLGVINKHQAAIAFNELDKEWIELFQNKLRLSDYKANTQKRILGAMRKFVKLATKQGHIKEDPFIDIKIGKNEQTTIAYLTEQEMNRLAELPNLDEKLFFTRAHFLHACYTGLRAVDQRAFAPQKHIIEGFIRIPMQKTGVTVNIPLNEQAKSLHATIQKRELKQSHSRIGEDLKALMALAGIAKHITFHCARHSFAINSLVKGVPLEVVSKWLGHTSIATTQIYAKVIDSLSSSEMDKWNVTQKKWLQVSINKVGNEIKPEILLDGKVFDLPLSFDNEEDLKKKVLMKLAAWFSN